MLWLLVALVLPCEQDNVCMPGSATALFRLGQTIYQFHVTYKAEAQHFIIVITRQSLLLR
jgi:hypothetical protein